MKTKIWVGIALVISLLLTINIIAFGLLPDYLAGKTDNNAIIINKSGSSLVANNIQDNSSQVPASASALQNQTPSTPAEQPSVPVVQPNQPVRVTSAS